jgi:hypothetical protein
VLNKQAQDGRRERRQNPYGRTKKKITILVMVVFFSAHRDSNGRIPITKSPGFFIILLTNNRLSNKKDDVIVKVWKRRTFQTSACFTASMVTKEPVKD